MNYTVAEYIGLTVLAILVAASIGYFITQVYDMIRNWRW